MEDMEHEQAEDDFYHSKHIVAVDLFRAPSNFFVKNRAQSSQSTNPVDTAVGRADGDEDELYDVTPNRDIERPQVTNDSMRYTEWIAPTLYLGICRQSGDLEVFRVVDIGQDETPTPGWSASGCGRGSSSLSNSATQCRIPRQHEVSASEIRFFHCGPAKSGVAKNTPGLSRPLCLAVETSAGDLHLYAADSRLGPEARLRFSRVQLKTVSRQSQEQARLGAKLRRKGIVSGSGAKEDKDTFRYNNLHGFHSLSEQDGLFAAVARPVWLLAERGRPTAVAHRLRHAAPAGGKALPISGFCSNLVCQ